MSPSTPADGAHEPRRLAQVAGAAQLLDYVVRVACPPMVDSHSSSWATGGYLGPPSTESWLSGAVVRCQKTDKTFPRVTAHALRHTAASLAISAGANPKVVQRMLGHAGAAMTLDVYADLFDSDLASVAESGQTVATARNSH
jgi:integrase